MTEADVWIEEAGSRNVAGTALIGKACDILELVGKAPSELNQIALAEKTSIPRATLYRILAALCARGFLRVDPVSQNYTLGFNFLEFAQNTWSGGDLASIASVELRRLRDLTGETAYFAVQQGYHVIALGRFESAHPQRSKAKLGALKPMHCTSQGKSFLAYWSDAQLSTYLQQELQSFTYRTIINPEQLRANLAIIRARGFAIDDEEIVIGTRCVGAPVLDADNRPVAAISVAAPVYRMSSERAEQLGYEIADVARRISAQLRPSTHIQTRTESSFEVMSEIPAFAGASPIWNTELETLFWIDRLAPALHGSSKASAYLSMEILAQSLVSACLLHNGALLAAGDHLALVQNDQIIEKIYFNEYERITSLHVSPSGQVWAAMLNIDTDTSMVGQLSPDGTVESLFDISGIVTDLAFSNENTLFATVPSRSSIYLLELAHHRKRRFSDIPKAAGAPCALALDKTGKLWVAMSDGWSILCIDEDGEIIRTLAVPVPQPTGIAFGGVHSETLFITSARTGVARESLMAAPLSGHVLSVDVGVSGQSEPVGVF